MFVSATLNKWFALASEWLAPPGMAGALTAAVVAAALYRRRVWRRFQEAVAVRAAATITNVDVSFFTQVSRVPRLANLARAS